MPFRSQAQWRWAFATGQPFADEWAKLTPGGKRRYALLRKRVQKKKSPPVQQDSKAAQRRARRDLVARYKADFEARGSTPGRKWSAGAGQVIGGNLARDASGRFASAAVASAVQTISRAQRQNTKKPKKPKVSAEQRASAGANGFADLGYSQAQYEALAAIRREPQPSDSMSENLQSLIDAGFAEIVGGQVVSTSLGKRVLSSVESGSTGDAQEAIARDEQKRIEREQKRQDRIDALDEKIATLEDRLSGERLSPRTRAVAERRLLRYRQQVQELTTSKEKRKAADGYVPPADVQAAAKRGLALRREFNRGGTEVGIARARDLSNGKALSAQTIRRMVSYFARHAVDRRPDWSNPSNPTAGYIAWMLWGGDAGRRWANAMNKRMVREKHLPGQHDQRAHGRSTPRRQTYRSAYQKARSEGSSPEEARAIARGASREVFRQQLEQRRADRDARRKKPKPDTTPDTTPKIPSVLDSSFKSLTPDQQAEVAINHFKNAPDYVSLFNETERLLDERNRIVREYNQRYQTSTTVTKEMADSAIKAHLDSVKALHTRQTELFHEVLAQLQVDNPTVMNVTYAGTMSKSARARIERTVQLVSGMFPKTSQRGEMNIEVRNASTRGQFVGSANLAKPQGLQYSVSGYRDPQTGQIISTRTPIIIPATPDQVKGTIKGNVLDTRLMIHETLHAFQYSTQALRDPCHDFAIQRIGGELPQPLSTLKNNLGYSSNEIGYRDAVDDPYTLKQYSGYGFSRQFYDSTYETRFLEVLTMGFESMAKPNTTDTGPLITALTAIKAAQQR